MLDTTALMIAEAPARLAELDKILAPFNRSDAPGLIVAIALNEQIIYRKAVGMANLEHGVANTPRTKVRIASTSKHFTGIGILLLVEDGLIKLDEPMQTYLPEFPVLSSKGPTIQQLLNHTSGWRAHDEIWAIANGLAFNEPGQGMPAMARQSALNFEPGTRMAYSNGGYHLLANIIERVSGKTYDQFLKERLFVPLGMPDTESVVTDLDVIAGLADRYIPTENGGWKHGVYPCELDGGGSLASTADDMLRWMAHLRSDTKIVGTVESWNALHKTATLTSGSKVNYGAGLARHPYRGVDIMHHAGAVLGATSQMLTVPQFGLDIIVLVNGAAIHPATLAIQIVDMLLDDVLPEKREPRPASADFAAILDRNYVNHDSGGVIGFSAAAEKLGFSWQAAAPAVMHHAGDRLWIGIQDLPINDMELKAHVAQQAEAPAEIEILEGGSPVMYSLLPKEVPSVASVADKLIGNYHSHDLDATASIELADDKLRMTFQGRFGQQIGVLDLLSEDVLTFTSTNGLMARLGKSALFVDRDNNGNVTALRLSSVRTRNVVLKRV